jgi:hypothetical protein
VTIDFDPGVGEANLTTIGEVDGFVLKLDSNGDCSSKGLKQDRQSANHVPWWSSKETRVQIPLRSKSQVSSSRPVSS